MSKFTPQVEIELGDSTYMLKCGFGTVAEFERMYHEPFFAAFKHGINIRAVLLLITIGCKHHRKFTEKQIADIFDEHPEQFQKIMNEAIPYMIEKMLPSGDDASEEADETAPLEKPAPSETSPRVPSIGGGS